MAKRKKKKRLQAVFIARRAVLLLAAVLLVGAAGWYAGNRILTAILPAEPEEEPSVSDPTPEPKPAVPADTEKTDEPEVEAPVEKPEADWRLILVSKTNPLPGDLDLELETIDGYQVDARIADDLKRMFAQALADGIDLRICSAYRTEEYQRGLYESKTAEFVAAGEEPEAAAVVAATIVAKPGMSEHQTGLAIDIVTKNYQVLDEGFALTPAFGWLSDNAHKYGFILRYPENKVHITDIIYEPWHYRYVGEEHAARIRESGYCLEEYLYRELKEQNRQAESAGQEEDEEQQSQQQASE